MNRTQGPPNRVYSIPPAKQTEPVKIEVETRPNGGMVSELDQTDIQDNQFSNITNCYVRIDQTSRRFGTTVLAPTKPDSMAVQNLFISKTFDGGQRLTRFARNGSLYYRTSFNWIQITGAPLNYGANDPVRCISVLNRFFFITNGRDVIQEINFSANSYAPLGNAPRFKYFTTFDNRVVGAYRTDGGDNPVYIGWSGDTNFDQWDPTIGIGDISAGFTFLIESQTDQSDFITGIFGFANQMLVLKEKTIWAANKQPVATNPFFFNTAVPNIGCDTPGSAQQIPNGVCFWDNRTRMVYSYTTVDAVPQPIGFPVAHAIQAQTQDLTKIFSSYNYLEAEYMLAIPDKAGGTGLDVWVYNFNNRSWRHETYNNVTSINTVDFNASLIVIDALVGTIDSLVGTIDSLSGTTTVPTVLLGKLNGDIIAADVTTDTDSGVAFTSIIESKNFRVPVVDMYATILQLTIKPILVGSFVVSYSRNDGKTYTDYRTVTTVTGDLNSRVLFTFKKMIRARQFRWKITATAGLFDFLEYNVQIHPAGDSRA